MPIFAIGIGEKIDDLQEFDAKNFAKKINRF
jgi:signal recognition particle GTPase